ncbi:stachyose synthase-like [Olea europaea subsp. europaea]|uniref:Stachyose synthase-like n=1 Tax=Olea europaea subsp. europaea TaxID=158383 RepID=A0A8S0QGS6_OLEEU|nr:stachyose synthase-like [Olea europaea subsp. europaea]
MLNGIRRRKQLKWESEDDKLLVITCNSKAIPITLQPFIFEVFSFVPIKKLSLAVKFGPVGLTNMFNSEGTIEGLVFSETSVGIELKGEGNFLAYSSMSPKKCYLNGA